MQELEDLRLGEEHLQRYLDSLPPDERRQAGRYARQFIAQAPDASRASLDAYFAWARQRYKSGSVRYIWGVIRRLYRVNGLEWPYRRHDIPTVSELDIFAPSLAPDVIIAMIEQAKKPHYPIRDAFYLAIATTYGCRREEMASLRKEHIDLESGLIYIETAKHGRQRYHLIPKQIVPIIRRYHRLVRPVHPATLSRVWWRIEQSIGFCHTDGVGWHSIRRSLDQYLLEHAKLPDTVVRDFLRWKRSSSDMAYLYASSQVIGWQGIERGLSARDRQVDETVFASHPFLPAWQ